jgi:hypothetical protein
MCEKIESILMDVKKEYPLNKTIFTDTKYEWIKNQSNVKKGKVGEDIIMKYLNANKSGKYEYDLTLDNKKIEVKLSCLNESGFFKWLNIRVCDDYTHLSLVAVEPNIVNLYLIPKDEVKYLKNLALGERGDSDIKYLGLKPNNEWLNEYKI